MARNIQTAVGISNGKVGRGGWALERVIDQYRVKIDKRSGITSDPNRSDDPEYIVRLIGQVITVSLETMKVVKSLPDLGVAAD